MKPLVDYLNFPVSAPSFLANALFGPVEEIPTPPIDQSSDLFPHSIPRNVELITEHLRAYSQNQKEEKTKALVLVPSKEHAYLYFSSFIAYLDAKNYTELRAMVSFTGLAVNEMGNQYSAASLNGFPSSEQVERFSSEDYQIYIMSQGYCRAEQLIDHIKPFLHIVYLDVKGKHLQAAYLKNSLIRASLSTGTNPLPSSNNAPTSLGSPRSKTDEAEELLEKITSNPQLKQALFELLLPDIQKHLKNLKIS